MNKYFIFIIAFIFLICSCKDIGRPNSSGSFSVINYSDKTIEFIWLTKKGELYPTAKNLDIGYGKSFNIDGVEAGIYDIAIDFKGEYNSFNSKKDRNLCLTIESGIKKVWVVDASGDIIRN